MRKNKPGADAPHAVDLMGEASTHVLSEALGHPLTENLGQPPAKKSLLQLAMDKVNANLTEIQVMSVRIDELIATNPADKVYSVATKDDYAAVDKIRKAAREDRLAVQRLNKASKELLNDLKDQAAAVALPYIDKLQGVEDRSKAALEAEDKKEDARKQRHRDAIAAIRLMVADSARLPSADIERLRNSVAAVIVDDSYEEFKGEALREKALAQDVLIGAHAAAVKREQEAAAKTAAEARQTAARRRIADLKALPDDVRDTGQENIQAIRDALARENYPEEEFGDLAEFVAMARDAAVRTLDMLLDLLAVRTVDVVQPLPAEGVRGDEPIDDLREERLDIQAVRENSMEAPEAGLLSNLPHDDEPTEEELGAAADAHDESTGNLFGAEAPPDVPPAIPQAAQRAAAVLEEDPFSQPLTPAPQRFIMGGMPDADYAAARGRAAPEPAPANVAPGATPPRMLPSGRMPIPRSVPQAVVMVAGSGTPTLSCGTPAPTPAPADILVTEVPNLLKAAQDFVTSAEECCGWTDPDNVPDALIPVWRALREATTLLSEFPPSN